MKYAHSCLFFLLFPFFLFGQCYRSAQNPLGNNPRIEITMTEEKAVIQINDFPAITYYFSPGEKANFPSTAYDAIFSDVRIVTISAAEPSAQIIASMTIRNLKKISSTFYYKCEGFDTALDITAALEKEIRREVVLSESVEVQSTHLTIAVWDNQEIDGDSVSVFFNGLMVLEKFALSKRPGVFEVTLSKGANVLTLFAHNLGITPPNTAAIAIDDGKARQTRVLSSNLHKCGAIELLLSAE
jgi:hypothetical protein